MNNKQQYYYDKMLEAFDKFEKDKHNTDTLSEILDNGDYLRRELMEEIKGYFIAVNDIGPEDDFTRYYTLLGFITEKQASEAVYELSDETNWGIDDHYIKVSKEKYYRYDALRRLVQCRTYLRMVKYVSKNSDSIRDLLESLKIEIQDLRKELDFTSRWEMISTDYWYPKCSN